METFKKVCIERFRKTGLLAGDVRPSPAPLPQKEPPTKELTEAEKRL